jgi:superfamily I DNA/RNA helicase
LFGQQTIWTQDKIHRSMTDAEEGRFVASTIFEQKMQNQMTNGQFAILYRTNNRSMEDACVKEISHTVFMEDYLYQRKEKMFLCYLVLTQTKRRRSNDVLIILQEELGIRRLKKLSSLQIITKDLCLR